jgi:hypothetical protein
MKPEVERSATASAGSQSPTRWRWRTRLFYAVVFSLAHLAFSRSMVHGQHAKLLRLAAFPLFIASRWSTGLSMFVRWHGGWLAAIVESGIVGVVLAAGIELFAFLGRRTR